MNQKLNPVVFFGSGPVAAKSLQLLVEWCGIELVITKRKPLHHKDPAPVEEYANKNDIKIFYADNKSELDTLINSIKPKSDIGIVIDYGVIISANTIGRFKYGIINSHFSLLPEWRGADPITFAILSGQKQTGVTMMRIDAGLDTGDIIAKSPLQISHSETNTTLTERLIEVSNQQLRVMMPLYINGQAVPMPQPIDNTPTYSRKLTKKDSLLDSNKPATLLEREIRAFNEWPKSKITLSDLTLVITSAKAINNISSKQGELKVGDDKKLYFGCKNSSLNITELKPAGKNKMSATAFINGYAHLLNN